MKNSGNERAAKHVFCLYDDTCRLRDILENECLDFLKNLPETIEIDSDGTKIKAIHDTLVNVSNGRILTTESAEEFR